MARGWAWTAITAVTASLAAADAALAPVTLLAVLAGVALIGLSVWRPGHVAPVLLVVGLLLTRPTIPGGALTTVGVGIAVLAAFIAVIPRRQPIRMSRAAVSLTVLVGVLWAWQMCLALAHDYYSPGQALKGAASVIAVLVATCLVCTDRLLEQRTLKLLIGATAAVCASAVVTYSVLATGSWALWLAQVPNPAYYSEVDLSLPFTLTTASQDVFGIRLPRFLGFAREPGLMQGFIIAAYFLLERVGWDRKRWLKLILVAGLIVTFSTAGTALFIIAWVVRFGLGGGFRTGKPMTVGRLSAMLVLLAAAVWAAINLPVFGVDAKSSVNAASVEDRYNNGLAGLSTLLDRPLGGATMLTSNTGINLISAISTIGAVGFLLAVLAFWRPVQLAADRRAAFVVVLPLFLTTLLAQPTLDAPLWWVLVLLAVGVAVNGTDATPDDRTRIAEGVRRPS